MLIEHLDGLVAYIKHKITNAYAESINGMIQLLKANARGYQRFENFRIAILFHFGKLNLYPTKKPILTFFFEQAGKTMQHNE